MIKNIGKKGLAIETVAVMILIILGFTIMVYFVYQMNWNELVDREVCHQSVIYRATLPDFAGSKEFVPLKCHTKKVCITSKFNGKCEEFEGVKGVSSVQVRDEEEIEQFIARDIVDCWETMGEGKLSLFSDWMTRTYGLGTISSSCIICSRIAFDKGSLEEDGIKLNEIDVLDYMISHKMPNREESYYVYLTGKWGKMSITDKREGKVSIETVEDGEDIESSDETDLFFEELEKSGMENKIDESVDEEELAVLFMQVYSPKYSGVLKADLVTLLGASAGGFVLAPKFMTKSAGAALKSPWTWGVLAIAGIFQMGSVSHNRAVTAGYCGDISIGGEASDGCSVVRTVNYNAEEISKYCTIIESIP